MNLNKMKLAGLRKLAVEKKVEGAEELETRSQLIEAIEAKLASNEPEEEPKAPSKEMPLEPGEGDTDEEESDTDEDDETSGEGDGDEPSRLKEPSVTGPGVVDERVAVGSKAERMKKKLAKQPKVRVLIPKEKKEPKGATFPVQINGYRLNIRKGVYVEVPEQIADVIRDSQEQTEAADEEFKRTETGEPMRIEGNAPSALQ